MLGAILAVVLGTFGLLNTKVTVTQRLSKRDLLLRRRGLLSEKTISVTETDGMKVFITFLALRVRVWVILYPLKHTSQYFQRQILLVS